MVSLEQYRSARPELSSSSPLANLQDLSSSEPISPGSPSPAFRRVATDEVESATVGGTTRRSTFLSPTNSHPDPFSANAKASPNAHPSFGKNQLRRKHVRDSPLINDDLESTSAWSRSAREQESRDEALGQHFFDSSDDNLSSDPGTFSFAAAGTSRSSWSSFGGSAAGLGIQGNRTGVDDGSSAMFAVGPGALLAEPFKEPLSPTLGNRKLQNRPFKRQISSSHDPLSGTSGISVLPSFVSTSQETVVRRTLPSTGSPRSQPTQQRRRLVGTSPKKLSRAAMSGRFADGDSDSDDEGPSWEQRVPAPRPASFDWQAEIRSLFDRGDSSLVLDERSITSIDPAIADLAKYVHLKAPSLLSRVEEEEGGTTSSPRGSSSFTRASSGLQQNSVAGQSDSAAASPTRTRSTTHANVQLSGGPQLNVAKNQIQKLPSALFTITNLTMLSLRANPIKALPPAIGELKNLRELNVSSCGLTYLPAEIQKLHLTGFYYFPNSFKPVPRGARMSVRRVYGEAVERVMMRDSIPEQNDEAMTEEQSSSTPGSMGPPAVPPRRPLQDQFENRTSFAASGRRPGNRDDEMGGQGRLIGRVLDKELYGETAFPTLHEMCFRRLLRPERLSSADEMRGGGTLLEQYEAGSLSRLDRSLNVSTVEALESARRSAAGVWGQYRPGAGREETWCTGVRFEGASESQRSVASESVMDGDSDDSGEASGEMSTDEELVGINKGKPVDVEKELDRGDDACRNAWFNRCPNPLHARGRAATEPGDALQAQLQSVPDWPRHDEASVFATPCVQRMEWVSHVGGIKVGGNSVALSNDKLGIAGPVAQSGDYLPLLWRGCGPRCLDFLLEC